MRKRVCFVTSSEITLRAFLVDQIRALAGVYDVTLVSSSFADDRFWYSLGVPVRLVSVALSRRIRPMGDAGSLLRLVRLFRRERFDLVHSVTPKAGMLSALAGVLAGVPLRLHTFTGQVWATRQGFSRRLLKAADKTIVSLLTDVLIDSHSQRSFLESAGVVRPGCGVVLGDGSISGVDADRFRPDASIRAALRERYSIPPSNLVYLFVGRLTTDKGVLTLAQAFARLHAARPDARLMVVGPDEEGLQNVMRRALGDASGATVFVDYTDRPEDFMMAADVFCLPSRREGFGTVLIEAAAVGLPSIATCIYGITDAVEDGHGGLLVPVDDASAFYGAMRVLAEDPERRLEMGACARARALRDFPVARLTSELMRFYADRLAEIRR